MPEKELLVHKKDGFATIVFNRPEVHNAFNGVMVEILDTTLQEIGRDPEIRCLILTGAGEKSFISGSDIHELSKRTVLSGIETSLKRQDLILRMQNLDIPTVAAVNGYAFGVGTEIALACTFRIASTRAKFGQLEINLGIIPGGGGTQRLARLVGKANAAELVLLGKVIDAEEAFRIGLVNKVVSPDQLLPECEQWARIVAEKSPIAIKFAMRALNQGAEVDLATGLKLESLYLGACFASEDSREGLSAFLEKRKARFKGA
jgi:enoyl-CoA hydratase